MEIYLSRKLLFYLFADGDLVTTATGWTREQCDELSDQTPPIDAETAPFETTDITHGIDAVRDALTLLAELSAFSLQAKVDEIELQTSDYPDRHLGFLPVPASNVVMTIISPFNCGSTVA